jgi:hypothetical protein
MQPFETPSVNMIRQLLVTVQAPVEDVERILDRVAALTPLTLGAYDSNSYETAPGFERYRPRQGAAAGEETAVRKRPGVSCVSFQIPEDDQLLAHIVEAIYEVHSYQEQVVMVQPILVSRTKGVDDSKNPHRWWNTTGDWKRPA